MSVHSLVDKAPSYHGHVYVIAFSNGTIKVGRTRRPRHRIRTHQDEARRFGISIENLWLSEHHVEYKDTEHSLICHMREVATASSGAEYFADADFKRTVAFANSLPRSAMSPKEIEERAEADKRRAQARVEAWLGPRGTEIPPTITALFGDFQRTFGGTRVERHTSEDERDEVIANIERLASMTHQDVDEILDLDYIDMMGRIARSAIDCQILKLGTWARQNGRADLLMTFRESLFIPFDDETEWA
ncbi:G-I-Y Y-I-G endonuclease [Gordonia phage Leroy]|nr:G-I-Y Y-I-G endonuclease [Gordonia phage Leroy]WIC40255.1 GIY-YIG endonuclease [Gordonia phage Holliday]